MSFMAVEQTQMMLGQLGDVGTGLLWAGMLIGGVLVLLQVVKSLLQICPPNEALIFSGSKVRLADGSRRGYRLVMGGRGLRKPFIEKVHRMNLGLIEVPISIRGAYSQGGIPLNVDAIANVKISSDENVIPNAIERFLGRDPNEIRRVGKETLEGHLRGVLARLTPEEVNEDRLKFADELSRESELDLGKLGIHLDTLKILHVSDDQKYLDSIGREAIANVIKDAEIAESDAKREAELVEAENQGRANVTKANVEAKIAQMRNELRMIQANLEAEVKSEEERTAAAAREARAKAEQELQRIRAELESIRLSVDRVLPAEAQRTAQENLARGEAAIVRERGAAAAKTVDLLNEAWAASGDAAMTILLIDELETILEKAALGVAKLSVDTVNVIDNGKGTALSRYMANYPSMLKLVFDSVADTTGIDVPGRIARFGSTENETDRGQGKKE